MRNIEQCVKEMFEKIKQENNDGITDKKKDVLKATINKELSI